MDKESADPDRVLNELTAKEIVPEQWGGDVPVAKVSAHSGEGIDELLDLIQIQAELMELKASEEGAAQGVVIEARVDRAVVQLLRSWYKMVRLMSVIWFLPVHLMAVYVP